MEFLQRVEPFLTTDDELVKDFVRYALQDYAAVPVSFTKKIIEKSLESEGAWSPSFLAMLKNFPLDEKILKLAINQAATTTDKHQLYFFGDFFRQFNPALVVQYKEQLIPYVTKGWVDWCEDLINCSEEKGWQRLGEITNALDESESYHAFLYTFAKKIVEFLIHKGWYDEYDVSAVLKEEKEADYFSANGILAVYAVSLLKQREHIPYLASLLVRYEDILVDEVLKTLISFQSDDVVEAVMPYVFDKYADISAILIIGNIKTPLAIQRLKEIYEAPRKSHKDYALEGLCFQLTADAIPYIDDYNDNGYDTMIYDKEEMFYAYYKIIGKTHPDLSAWRQIGLERKAIQKRAASEYVLQETNKPTIPIKKVGRNEPCHCGSGKKYKKCCGKNT